MDAGKFDYQFISYAGAIHAFTNPKADEVAKIHDIATPPLSPLILGGITRELVLEWCATDGVEVVELVVIGDDLLRERRFAPLLEECLRGASGSSARITELTNNETATAKGKRREDFIA